MTEPRESIDLENLPRFLKHLGHRERDPMASAFAKHLLDEGGEVVVFWGPQQMDVWQLTIRRGGYLITFGRAMNADGPAPSSSGPPQDGTTGRKNIPLHFAVFGWARAHAVDLALDDPLSLHTDLLAHGTAALDLARLRPRGRFAERSSPRLTKASFNSDRFCAPIKQQSAQPSRSG